MVSQKSEETINKQYKLMTGSFNDLLINGEREPQKI